MTSRERVRKAIHFQGPDRVPHFLPDGKENDLIWFWLCNNAKPRMDWTNYGDHDRMIDAWGSLHYRAVGGEKGFGEVLEPAIKDITRQTELEFPDLNRPEVFIDACTVIAENNRSANPKYCLGVMPFSGLFEGVHQLTLLDQLFIDFFEHPDDVKALIARLAEAQRESIRQLAAIGCDGVMGYDDWGLQDRQMIGNDMIEEFFLPHYQENWRLAHDLGMDVWLHSCGYTINVLPLLNAAGLDVAQLDQQENMGLENLSEKLGGKLAFWCPVDVQRTMIDGSDLDIENYVKRMINTIGSHNGGLISKTYPTPQDIGHTPEKLAVASAAFRKYEKYQENLCAPTI